MPLLGSIHPSFGPQKTGVFYFTPNLTRNLLRTGSITSSNELWTAIGGCMTVHKALSPSQSLPRWGTQNPTPLCHGSHTFLYLEKDCAQEKAENEPYQKNHRHDQSRCRNSFFFYEQSSHFFDIYNNRTASQIFLHEQS